MDPRRRNINKTIQRKLSNLVGDLDKLEPRVRALLELSVSCVLPADTALETERPETGEAIALFSPASEPPVPKKGRQTYRMWKAMVELDSSPFRKSRLKEMVKLLRFIPLERYNIGAFDIDGLTSSVSEFLVMFLEAFFPGLEVILETPYDITHMNPVNRFHKATRKKQYLVTDIYTRLHVATGFNKSDYILGLTWTDLYPSEDLNFALGEALYSHRCAVFSFGRFEPLSYIQKEKDTAPTNIESSEAVPNSSGEGCCKVGSTSRTGIALNNGHAGDLGSDDTSDERTSKERRSSMNAKDRSTGQGDGDGESDDLQMNGDLLWKMMRVSSHEICHLFGLSHCVFFHCAMNESKSVAEALSQPLYLCPVCLRKLQKFFSFDVLARYQKMLGICLKVQRSYPSESLGETIDWLRRVIEFLSSECK